jgi:hypothetical protein
MTEINRQTILLQEVVGVVIIVVWVGRVVPGGIFFQWPGARLQSHQHESMAESMWWETSTIPNDGNTWVSGRCQCCRLQH